jgi:uncharacterized protein YigE (DUF2233 family)
MQCCPAHIWEWSHGGRAFFMISNDAVSFGRFARFLRDGLGCPDILFLDGSVSSL